MTADWCEPLQPACWQLQPLNDEWRRFYQGQWTLLQYWRQSLSLGAALCQKAGCFACEPLAEATVIQSQKSAYSAQKQECVVRFSGWMQEFAQVISILMRRDYWVIYYWGNAEKNAQAGFFFFFPFACIFLFELNNNLGRQRRDGENARKKDVLHLPILNVVFSSFKMKKTADRIADPSKKTGK